MDGEDTCSGRVCRIDLEFSKEINLFSENWNSNLEARNGFNRRSECLPFSVVRAPETGNESLLRSGTGTGSDKTPRECCGSMLQQTMYRPDIFECCSDGTVNKIGSC